jgi:hypothetical protein
MPDEEHIPLPGVTIPVPYLSFRWTHWKVNGPHQSSFFMGIYRRTMKIDRFFQVLRLLHLDHKNISNKTDKNYNYLWKMRTIFHKLNGVHATYYSPMENSALDETVQFKGRTIFNQHTPK